MHIFRIIVRGRFDALDDESRAALRAELGRTNELDTYAFSPDGTLTFDRRLDFWSVRAEVRVRDDESDDPKGLAEERATALAQAHLAARGVAGRDLRCRGQAMADVWR